MVEAVTDNNFEEETKEGLVIIDFWAPWCGPCRMQSPVLESFAEEHEGEVKVVKLNTDENPETTSAFGVMSIPTLLIKKEGEAVEKAVGLQQKPQLEQLIAKYL